MKRNHLTKYLILLTFIVISTSISGCTYSYKKNAVGQNEKNSVKLLESHPQKNVKVESNVGCKGKNDELKNTCDKKDQDGINKSNVKSVFSKSQVKPTESEQVANQTENVNVKQTQIPVQSKKIIGIVKNIYESDGKRYLTVDEVEFYMGDRAMQEAIKDNKIYYDKDGKPELDDGYYIRNTDQSIKEYEISDSAKFSAPNLVFDMYDNENLAPNHPASYDKIKNAVNGWTAKYSTIESRINLYWLTMNNNVVVQMDQQYTP